MAKLTKNQTAAAILAHLKTPHAAHPPVTSKALPVQSAPRLHPWFCRYDSAAAAVLIYLPEDSVAAHRLDRSDLTAHASLPDFYTVPYINTGTGGSSSGSFPSWRVVVSLEVSGTTVTPTFYSVASDVPDGAIVIAETTEDGLARPVRQYVTGAISLGGGGIEQTLGPLEYEYSNSRIVQYMGTWVLTPASGTDPASWTFIKAKDAEGNLLPPASIISVATAKILIQQQIGVTDHIARITAPIIFPVDRAQTWLSRQTANVTKTVDYSSPGSELDTGALTTTDSEITYFESQGQRDGVTRTLLTTITEDANDETTYEQEAE